MTFLELKESLKAKLDDPSGDVHDASRLGRLLNEGYRKVVLDVERLGQNLGVSASPVTVSVTSAAREYAVTPSGYRIRRIVDVSRTDLSRPVPVRWTHFAARDTFVEYPAIAQLEAQGFRVYLYRRSDGEWVLGTTDSTPITMTLKVWYMPQAETLTYDNQTPLLVAEDAHDLIVYWAAVCGKIEENRDSKMLADQYGLLLRDMATTMGAFAGRTRMIAR